MADVNILFCRALLTQVQPALTKVKKRVFADAWVWTDGTRRIWEFHGPDQFYWHGRADNAYHARYKGWCAWLEEKGYPL